MLKAVIIGCGNIAGGYDTNSKKHDYWSHVKSYNANKDVKVAGVYEINTAVRDAFVNYWGIEKGYDSISDMLLKTQPEIVSICSPNRFHFEQIIECADAGVKTILCEKPLSMDTKEVKKAIDYCAQKKVGLVVNYLRNWDKCFNSLAEELMADNGEDIESIHVHYNKGVFHNASHFIHFFSQCLGLLNKITVINKLRSGDDALADFLLSFEKCNKVYFFNHQNANTLITEIEIFFRNKRLRIENGGIRFVTEDYHTGSIKAIKGTIHKCMRTVIDDIVNQTANNKQFLAWNSVLVNTVKTSEICEQIVHS